MHVFLELHTRPDLIPEAANIIYKEWTIELASYHRLYDLENVEKYIASIPCFVTLEDDKIVNITLIEDKDWIVDVPLGPWLSNIIIDKLDEKYTQFMKYILSWFRSFCYEYTLYCWSFDDSITQFYLELGYVDSTTLIDYKGIDKVVILGY